MSNFSESIGLFVKQLVEKHNLTPTEFGRKINKTSQNVLDIYKRTAIDSELLLIISKELNENVFAYFDEIEPIKTFRTAQNAEFDARIATLESEKSALQEKVTLLENHLADKQKLVEALEKLTGG